MRTLITQERFLQDIKDYFKECIEKNYPEFIMDSDLRRMIDYYTEDVEEYTRNEVTEEIRESTNSYWDYNDYDFEEEEEEEMEEEY